MNKVLLSIISHNQQELVQKLMDSIDNYLDAEGCNIIIVITENSLKEINITSKNFKIEKIINLREKGFGSNHNATFERHDSDYFLIINPDAELTSRVKLKKVIQDIERQKLTISTPKIYSFSGNIENYRRSDLNIINLFKKNLLKLDDKKSDWFPAIFLIVKSRRFREINGFDTDFFMYVEDCDLCMRARKAGMHLGEIENFSIMHDARRASRKSVRHLRWHISSILKYLFLK